MKPRIAQFLEIIEAWKRKDVDFIIDQFHEDIVWHYAAAVAPPVRGKQQARAFLDRFGAGIAEVRWRIFDHCENEDRLFLEGVDEYTSSEGIDVAVPYAGVVEFEGDKIIGWRDYIDRGTIDAMKAGGAWPPQVKELVDRPAV